MFKNPGFVSQCPRLCLCVGTETILNGPSSVPCSSLLYTPSARGPINLRFYVLLYYTWSNIPLSHSYCHNSGQSKTGLSNLEWYYYRKIATTPSPHTTTTPPPHVPLQLKAIQCIQYYVT